MPLAVIKLAEGGSTNRFCEGQVQRGAANRIAALKLRFTVDIWEAIVASARGVKALVIDGPILPGFGGAQLPLRHSSWRARRS
ncbi:protein of unknown function [Candidatus Filomicrobium marinum]|uniref:Uncharacterized protein n=1 Tax=Candidatus Filomicrobium marinum TaxID=1608628 RepID=A0A0D6JK87_9HYPH|nr:protein of unknown function [Candidatus Filomicrobium marinum]CPR22102.1 protein of unknown function [Candidatus Filomicrobium marinum]